jgi:hypothetical protein
MNKGMRSKPLAERECQRNRLNSKKLFITENTDCFWRSDFSKLIIILYCYMSHDYII